MRAITIHITTSQGGFGAFHRGLMNRKGVSLQALHELRLLNDGSTVMLYEYSGEQETAEELAREYLGQEDVEWQIGRIDDNELMYAHAEPSGTIQTLLWLLGEYRVVVDWPITFPRDEEAKVTLIGDDDQFRQSLSNLPDRTNVRVERKGTYRPELERLASGLTERERRTVLTAVGLGYYQNPRQANYEDIADELDCSTGTVGTHLRNAESKVMQELMTGESAPDTASRSPVVR